MGVSQKSKACAAAKVAVGLTVIFHAFGINYGANLDSNTDIPPDKKTIKQLVDDINRLLDLQLVYVRAHFGDESGYMKANQYLSDQMADSSLTNEKRLKVSKDMKKLLVVHQDQISTPLREANTTLQNLLPQLLNRTMGLESSTLRKNLLKFHSLSSKLRECRAAQADYVIYCEEFDRIMTDGIIKNNGQGNIPLEGLDAFKLKLLAKGLDQGRTEDEKLAPERESLNKKLDNFSSLESEKLSTSMIESARKYLSNIFSSK